MAMLNNQIVHRIFQGSAFKKEMIPNSEDRSPYCFPILGAKPTTSFQAWFHWRRISGTLHLWESHSWVTGAASCHGIHAMLAVQRRRLSHDFARVSMIDRSWGIRNVATPCNEHSLDCVNFTQPWDPWDPKMCMALMSCDMNLYSFLQPEWLSTIWSRSVSSIHFMHVLSFPGMYEKSERKVRIYIATRGCWETPMDFGSNFETGLWLASNLLAFTAPELRSGEVERKGPCKELGAGAIYVQSIPSLDWYPIQYLESLQ